MAGLARDVDVDHRPSMDDRVRDELARDENSGRTLVRRAPIEAFGDEPTCQPGSGGYRVETDAGDSGARVDQTRREKTASSGVGHARPLLQVNGSGLPLRPTVNRAPPTTLHRLLDDTSERHPLAPQKEVAHRAGDEEGADDDEEAAEPDEEADPEDEEEEGEPGAGVDGERAERRPGWRHTRMGCGTSRRPASGPGNSRMTR